MTIRRMAAAGIALLVTAGLTACGTSVVGEPTPDARADKLALLSYQIRAADPCAAHNMEFLKRFGTQQKTSLVNNFTSCWASSFNPSDTGDFPIFQLNLAKHYTEKDRAQDTSEHIAGRTVYSGKHRELAQDRCSYFLPYEGIDLAIEIGVLRAAGDQAAKPAPWPERCDVAKEYVAAVAAKAMELSPRSQDSGRSLVGKNPCARHNQIIGQLPEGWRVARVQNDPYDCTIQASKDGEARPLEVTVKFERTTEPTVDPDLAGKNIEIAGLQGVQSISKTESAELSCAVSLTYVPATSTQKTSAQVISIEAGFPVRDKQNRLLKGKTPQGIQLCDLVNQIAPGVVTAVG